MRVYRLWGVLVGGCHSDLWVADDLGSMSMDKKRVKNGKSAKERSLAKIPPRWQLSAAQRDFIDDLWQADCPDSVPALPTRHDVSG